MTLVRSGSQRRNEGPTMSGLNINAALGIADDEHALWPQTRAAIQRTGFHIKRAPGAPTSKLGQGSFATVYYAEHQLNKRPAAIKVFHTEAPDLVESFKNESKTIEGPEFPRQFAADTYLSQHEPGTQPFLILEYVRGKPIDEHVADGKPAPECRIELIEQLLAGVQSLHERNITHRDLSVGNVLVDQQGRVRLLDFGEAGEIVRATQHTTLRNPLGNRDYSPAEQLRGEKRAGSEDDLFNCAMIAVHVLSGKTPPPNETRSGDPRHLARCRGQLRESGVSRSLSRIIAGGLREPHRRYRQARNMGDQLFDYRVRRPQRQRTVAACLGMLATLVLVAALFWWRSLESQQALALSQYNILQRQASDLKFRSDPSIARRLEEIGRLEDQWSGYSIRGDRARAAQTLGRIVEQLQEVIRVNAGMERAYPRREALGTALQAMAWARMSARIMARKQAAEAAYKAISELLAEGQTDEAWEQLDALQRDIAQLTGDNVRASQTADVRLQFQLLETRVAPRLREVPGFSSIMELAQHGHQEWEAGRWEPAQLDYGQARQRLSLFLEAHETPAERTAREQAAVEAPRSAEVQRQQQLAEIVRLTNEQQQLKDQIVKLHQQSVTERQDLAASREQLQTETKKRLAAEQAVQYQTTLVAKLQQEQLTRAQDLQMLEQQTAHLTKPTAERAQADRPAPGAADPLANVQRQWETALRTNAPRSALAATSASLAASQNWGSGRALDGVFAGQQAGARKVLRLDNLTIALRWCPPGRFRMGSPPSETERDKDESPVDVELRLGYWLGMTETTQALWTAVMGTTVREQVAKSRFSSLVGEGAEYPMYCVSHAEATEFCTRLTQLWRKAGELPPGWEVALPTEAQWEYACRAGTTTRFCFGDGDPDPRVDMWYKANSSEGQPWTHPVGQKKANAWGLYDMHGNVEEWCSDYYADSCAKAKTVDPEGPASGLDGVVRGGGGPACDAQHCRSAYRYVRSPGARNCTLGFRVSMDLKFGAGLWKPSPQVTSAK